MKKTNENTIKENNQYLHPADIVNGTPIFYNIVEPEMQSSIDEIMGIIDKEK